LAVTRQGKHRSLAKEAQYWKIGDGFNTMFTLWNPTQHAQRVPMTLFFGSNAASYRLPLSLV
jgi:hypothetical protein